MRDACLFVPPSTALRTCFDRLRTNGHARRARGNPGWGILWTRRSRGAGWAGSTRGVGALAGSGAGERFLVGLRPRSE